VILNLHNNQHFKHNFVVAYILYTVFIYLYTHTHARTHTIYNILNSSTWTVQYADQRVQLVPLMMSSLYPNT